MKIIFEYVTIKNFLSYGNTETKIPLCTDTFTLISGENGTGKSTSIVDGISFALFGKIHRKKITQKQVINNVNKKGCEVSVMFSTENGTKYTIKRGLKPNYLELLKDGKEMKKLSSAGLVQAEIDRLIQMDALTFQNISVLSVNTSKPFVDLEPKETRSITENLMGLKLFSLMLDSVKKRLKDTKDILKDCEKDYGFTREIVRDGKEKLQKYKELKEKFEKEKQECIDALEKELKESKAQLKPLQKKLTDDKEIKILTDALDVKETYYEKLREEFTRLDMSVLNYDTDIYGKEEEIKFFTDNSTCPTCASEMDDKHRKGHISSYKKEITALKRKIKDVKKKVEGIESESSALKEDISNQREAIKSMRDANRDAENDMRNVERDIMVAKRDITAKKEDSIDNHISGLLDKGKIREYVEKFRKLKTEKESLEVKVKHLNALKTVLSDEGVKASAIKKDLPFLNTSIKKYMTAFEKSFYVEFSDTFEVTMKGFSKKGLNYYSLSAGEKKRIDLAILLSFIDMTRNKNSVHTNILILDELLDSSIDSIAQEIFISILKEKIKAGQLQNIFVVSHNKDLVIEDAIRVECYKDGEFSKIRREG